MKNPGITHKELKLRNVYIDSNGQPKVTNFSISKSIKVVKLSKANSIDLVFNAPEVILDHEFTASSDVWSVGVMAYTLLVGYRPFSAREPVDMVQKMK